MCHRDRKIMKSLVLAVLVLNTVCRGSDYYSQRDAERRLLDKIRESGKSFKSKPGTGRNVYEENNDYYSDAHKPHENRHDRPCTAEYALSTLRNHFRQGRPLSNVHSIGDKCLSSYFSEDHEDLYRKQPHHIKSMLEYNPKPHYDVSDDESSMRLHSKPPKKIYCVPPFHGENCEMEYKKRNHDTFHSLHNRNIDRYRDRDRDRYRGIPDSVVYSLRGFVDRGKNSLKKLSDQTQDKIKDKFKNISHKENGHYPNENTEEENTDHSYQSTSQDDSTAPFLPMYCSLLSGKIIPYIIAYGPPDERKRQVYINFSNSGMDPYRRSHENNPLRSLNVTDTILSSPLTNRDLSGLVSKIENLSSFTKIVHISINDTPILRVNSEYLLHPMCTEGSLCLVGRKCVNTTPGACSLKKKCLPPTVNNFIRSIPKNKESESVSMPVYNAKTREFAIEDIFLRSEEISHQHMLEYAAIEAPLLETSPICEKTVKVIQDAILTSKYGYSKNGQYNHTAYIVESNNTRGFIVFLLIKQILEDDSLDYISKQTKQQMSSVYLDIFKHKIKEDLIEPMAQQDISQIIEVLNLTGQTRHQRDRPHTGHTEYPSYSPNENIPDRRKHVNSKSTYEEDYGVNGNGHSTYPNHYNSAYGEQDRRYSENTQRTPERDSGY